LAWQSADNLMHGMLFVIIQQWRNTDNRIHVVAIYVHTGGKRAINPGL
jgi:hypothetical protein